MVKLYEIMIPLKNNDGASYDKARGQFEEHVLEVVGGFTRLEPCNGLWRDPGDFCTYVEGMIPLSDCVLASAVQAHIGASLLSVRRSKVDLHRRDWLGDNSFQAGSLT